MLTRGGFYGRIINSCRFLHSYRSQVEISPRVPPNSTTNGLMEVEKGLEVNWERVGKGPHVVLGLPGLVGTYRDNFAPVFKKMDGNQFTMIGWDPPGYGKSRPPDRKVLDTKTDVLRQDAQLAAKLMQKLGYKRYSLVGCGNGGRTGALLASFYPDRVNKLVLCGAPKFTDERSCKVAKYYMDLNNWTPEQRRRLKKSYELTYLENLLADHEKYVQEEYNSQKEAKVFDEDLKKVTAPTLIIYGIKDAFVVPEHAKQYQTAIANSKLYEVKDGAHDHLEFLDEFVTATVNFLADA